MVCRGCDFRNSEIQNLRAPALRHEDIRRLHIAMNDSRQVGCVQSFDDVCGQTTKLAETQRTSLNMVLQRGALQELHCDKQQVVAVSRSRRSCRYSDDSERKRHELHGGTAPEPSCREPVHRAETSGPPDAPTQDRPPCRQHPCRRRPVSRRDGNARPLTLEELRRGFRRGLRR
jgi:hypothetical protein